MTSSNILLLEQARLLRLYRLYCLYDTWYQYLLERNKSVFTIEQPYYRACAILMLLRVEKKQQFADHSIQLPKQKLLTSIKKLINNQPDPLVYLQQLSEQAKQKVAGLEQQLMQAINYNNYLYTCALELMLCFMVQPSYQIGSVLAKQVLQQVEQLPDHITIKLKAEKKQLFPYVVGVACVLLDLLLLGWVVGFNELLRKISIALFSYTNQLLAIFAQLDRITCWIENCLVNYLSNNLLNSILQYWLYGIEYLRWDALSFSQKEQILTFTATLLLQVLLAKPEQRYVLGSYFFLLASLTAVSSKLIHYKFPWLAQDQHYYSDEEINELLTKHQQTDQIEHLYPQLASTNNRVNLAVDALVQAQQITKLILLPSNINYTHWILLVLINNQQPARLIYFDPLGTAIPEDLEASLNNTSLPTPEPLFIEKTVLQTDGHSCGPWLVAAGQLLMQQDTKKMAQLKTLSIQQARYEQMTYLYGSTNPYAKPSPMVSFLCHMLVALLLNYYLLPFLSNYLPKFTLIDKSVDCDQTTALTFFNLTQDAMSNPVTIKQAYRSAARLFHPDKTGGSDAMMTLVNEYYECLTKK